MNFLKNIDLFGLQFNFKFEKADKFKTTLGGVLSLVLIFTIASAIALYSLDYIYKNNPKVTVNSYMKDYPFLEINNTNFFFAFRLIDINFNNIQDPRYFEFEFEHEVWEKDKEKETYFVAKNFSETPEKCKFGVDILNNDTDKNSLQSQLHLYHCVKSNYTIGGSYSGDKMSYPNFMVKRCNAKTEKKYGITCASETEIINKYQEGIFVSYFIQKNFYVPENSDKTIQPTYHHYITALDLDNILKEKASRLKVFIYYSTGVREDDIGYFDVKNETETFMEFDERYAEYSFPTSSYVFNIRHHMSRKKVFYHRSYIKFQEIISQIGGQATVTYYVIDFLYSFYLVLSYKVYLITKLFKLEFENDEEELVIDTKFTKLLMIMIVLKISSQRRIK